MVTRWQTAAGLNEETASLQKVRDIDLDLIEHQATFGLGHSVKYWLVLTASGKLRLDIEGLGRGRKPSLRFGTESAVLEMLFSERERTPDWVPDRIRRRTGWYIDDEGALVKRIGDARERITEELAA